jgi:hypothetical protein
MVEFVSSPKINILPTQFSSMATNDWIGKAKVKPGALHRQLGYSVGDNIPTPVLNRVQKSPVGTLINGRTVTPLMKKRVNFALNMRKK